MENKKRNAVTYEYREIKAPENQIPFYLDCYESFGWEVDERVPGKHGIFHIRRDRKRINRTELIRLQRNFEACMDEIHKLEKSKTASAKKISWLTGLGGTIFMAGATFAATAAHPLWGLCAILAVPGFAGWILAPVLYKKTVAKRTKTVDVLVEEKYDEVYQICEKGQGLL